MFLSARICLSTAHVIVRDCQAKGESSAKVLTSSACNGMTATLFFFLIASKDRVFLVLECWFKNSVGFSRTEHLQRNGCTILGRVDELVV